MSVSSISHSRTIEEMVDFWDAHSLADYHDQTHEVEMVFDPSAMSRITKLEAFLQDIEDLAAIAERRNEPTVSHEDFVAELKQDGWIDAGVSQ